MISPMMVYLVMQADSLVAVFFMLGLLGTIGGGIFYIASIGEYDEEDINKLSRKAAIAGIVFCVLAAATPTTKTAAAMIVLPAVTSETAMESMAPEARELYDLTKDALRSLGKKNKPESDD